jgi:ribosomal protein L37E
MKASSGEITVVKKKEAAVCPDCGATGYSREHKYCPHCGKGQIFI